MKKEDKGYETNVKVIVFGTIAVIFIILIIWIINTINISKKKIMDYPDSINYETITWENPAFGINITEGFDSSGVIIYNNIIKDFVVYPNSYVYEFILPDADTLRRGLLYSKLPYLIPINDGFHETKIDTRTVYLRLKEIRK